MKLDEAKEILNKNGYLLEDNSYEEAEAFKQKFIEFWGDAITNFRKETKDLNHISLSLYHPYSGFESLEDMAESAYDAYVDYGDEVEDATISMDYWIKEIGNDKEPSKLSEKEQRMINLISEESDCQPFDLSFWKDENLGDFLKADGGKSTINFLYNLDKKLDKFF